MHAWPASLFMRCCLATCMGCTFKCTGGPQCSHSKKAVHAAAVHLAPLPFIAEGCWKHNPTYLAHKSSSVSHCVDCPSHNRLQNTGQKHTHTSTCAPSCWFRHSRPPLVPSSSTFFAKATGRVTHVCTMTPLLTFVMPTAPSATVVTALVTPCHTAAAAQVNATHMQDVKQLHCTQSTKVCVGVFWPGCRSRRTPHSKPKQVPNWPTCIS